MWYDQNMDQIDLAAMKEGIRNSVAVLVLLTPGMMGRKYCQQELTWAQQYQLTFVGVRRCRDITCTFFPCDASSLSADDLCRRTIRFSQSTRSFAYTCCSRSKRRILGAAWWTSQRRRRAHRST